MVHGTSLPEPHVPMASMSTMRLIGLITYRVAMSVIVLAARRTRQTDPVSPLRIAPGSPINDRTERPSARSEKLSPRANTSLRSSGHASGRLYPTVHSSRGWKMRLISTSTECVARAPKVSIVDLIELTLRPIDSTVPRSWSPSPRAPVTSSILPKISSMTS